MPVTISEFLDRLESSGILDAADLQSVRDEVSGDLDGAAEKFVKTLHKSGRVTGYQAQALWKDKGHKLAFGNYVIEDELGRGGMGVVLKARHKRMQRYVAIKVLPQKMSEDAEAIARFQREVVAASQLSHQNIVGAYDADEIDGQHVLIIEFVDGRDLSAIVRKQGPFSIAQAVDCIKQAAAGLAYAHEQGVVHRDVKPANLLLDAKGTVKILDMGLARFDDSADVGTQAELTGTGTVMGTVDYMSPEQALSTKSADAKSDQYSLGISLYFLLTGNAAYTADSLMGRLLAHREEPIPSLRDGRPDVPEAVQAVFERMVAKKPEDRFPDMGAVIAALDAIDVGGTGTVATAAAPGTGADAGSVQLGSTGGAVDPHGATMPPTGAWDDSAAEHEGATRTAVATAEESAVDEQTIVGTPESGTMPVLKVGVESKPAPRTSSPSWTDHLRDWRVLAGAGGTLALLIAVFFLVGPDGTTLRVEIDDPEIEVSIKGTTIVLTKADTKPITIESGEHVLKVTRGDFSFETDMLILNKGETVVVKAEIVQGELRALRDGVVIGSRTIDAKPVEPSGALRFALEFDGADDHVEVPVIDARLGDEYTLEAWIDTKDLGDRARRGRLAYVAEWKGDVEAAINQMLKPTGEIQITAGHRDERGFMGVRSPLLPARQHVAAVHWAGQLAFYVDGRRVGTNRKPTSDPFEPIQPVRLTMGGHSGGFLGRIDELRISTVARYEDDFRPKPHFDSDANTLALYHFDEGSGDVLKDSSGNGRHGKITGAKWVRVNGGVAAPPPNTPPPAVAPFDAAAAKAHQEAWAKYLGEPVVTTNSIGMKLAVIPPGKFRMGEGEEAVDVTLTRPFRLGVHEVTQGQWREVMGTEPWMKRNFVREGDDFAVTYETLPEAVEFCRRLTERERSAGTLRAGWEYRLPTEAEWEHACRAGTTTLYSFGDEVRDLHEYAWYDANALKADEAWPHEIGLKKPNPWGLHDVHGNVWERCSDWYTEALPGGTDPEGPTEGTERAYRGGGYRDTPEEIGSGTRGKRDPLYQSNGLGVRPVLGPVKGAAGDSVGSLAPEPTGPQPPPAVAPFDAAAAKAHQEAWAKYLGEPVVTTNSIGMKFVVTPPGEVRGAGPRIVITKPFAMGVYEVTQAEYKTATGSNPSGFTNRDRNPVESTSWLQAIAMCNSMSKLERLNPYYRVDGPSVTVLGGDGYRLPTAMEWEYAARSGTTTTFHFGDDASVLGEYAWHPGAEGAPQPVGGLKPNPWGMFDLYGNVYEWCWDRFGDIPPETLTDYSGPDEGEFRTLMGGCFNSGGVYCRSNHRVRDYPNKEMTNNYYGFRVARSLPLPTE